MLFVTKCLLTQIRPLNWFQFFGLQIDEMYLYNPHFLSYPRYIILVNCLKEIDLFLNLIFKILKTLKKSNIKLNVTISVWLYHFDINVKTITGNIKKSVNFMPYYMIVTYQGEFTCCTLQLNQTLDWLWARWWAGS